MTITLHLTPEQEAKLSSVAGELKVSPEAPAETVVRDLLARPDDEFLDRPRGGAGNRRGKRRAVRAPAVVRYLSLAEVLLLHLSSWNRGGSRRFFAT
jgi:hypothetical protein